MCFPRALARVRIRSRSTAARPSGTAAPNDRGGGEQDQAAAVCTKTIISDFQAKSPVFSDRAPLLAERWAATAMPRAGPINAILS